MKKRMTQSRMALPRYAVCLHCKAFTEGESEREADVSGMVTVALTSRLLK